MELRHLTVRSMRNVKGSMTYGKGSFPEHNHVHIDGIQVSRAIWILVETPETDEVVIAE